MRVLRGIAAVAVLATLAMTLAGCAGPGDRNALLEDMSPALMREGAWAQVRGTYTGPVRSVTQRFGFEGQSAMEVRLDLSGWAGAPGVVLRMENGYSTAWAMYGERKGTYTNIPSKRYGTQGYVYATTHYPNVLVVKLRRYGLSATTGTWLILRFEGNGVADVDLIGHSGWRGDGELWRVTPIARRP